MFRKTIAGASLGALLLVAGCTSGTTGETAQEGGLITIGGIGPLSGDAASYGIEFQRSAELALADVNEAWAEKGMELKIQWEDGLCSGRDASSAAQKLMDVNKVQVILGGFCSSETLAASAVTDPAGVLLFSSGSSSPDVTDAGEYVFRNWPSDSFQGELMAELANDLGYKSIGIITEQQDYTFGISKVLTQRFEELGGATVEESFISDENDFKTQLTRLKGADVDVIFLNAQTPTKGEVVIKQMKELGFEGPFLINDAIGTYNQFLQNNAEYIEGSYTATLNVDEGREGISMFKESYMTAHNEEANFLGYNATTYDAVWLLANAIEAVGNDGEAVRQYLNDLSDYEGIMGPISFDENGDPQVGHSVFMIQGGEMVLAE